MEEAMSDSNNETVLGTVRSLRNANMCEEYDRLATFRNWQLTSVKAEDLAQFGFFYVGPHHSVQCSFCDLVIPDWKTGDSIQFKHDEKSPDCDINVRSAYNIPLLSHLGYSRYSNIEKRSHNPFIYDPGCRERFREYDTQLDYPYGKSTPYLNSLASRLRTFINCPSLNYANTNELAEAGFFYAGEVDKVVCFSCGGSIFPLITTVEPWLEHTLRFPRCGYIIMNTEIMLMAYKPSLTNDMPIFDRTIKEFTVHYKSPKFQGATSNYLKTGTAIRLRKTNRYNEYDRLVSFRNWKCPFVSAEELAYFGFFHTGPFDQVQCVFCNNLIGYWKSGDSVKSKHDSISPNCDMAMRTLSNIPLISHPWFKVCSDDGNRSHNSNIVKYDTKLQHPYGKSAPYLASFTKRKATFGGWREISFPRPKDLAEAGFYYTGRGDRVVCFYCGGAISRWQDRDPWVEHALLFPRCGFVIKNTEMMLITFVPNAPVSVSTQTELSEPENSKLCKICFFNDPDVLIVPCCHLVCCRKCAVKISICPRCEGYIDTLLEVLI